MNLRDNSFIPFLLAWVGVMAGVFGGSLISRFNPALGTVITLLAIIAPVMMMGIPFAIRYFHYLHLDIYTVTRRYVKHTVTTVLAVDGMTTRKIAEAPKDGLGPKYDVFATIFHLTDRVYWDDQIPSTDAVIMIHTRPITERLFLERRDIAIDGEVFSSMSTDNITVWEYEQNQEYLGNVYPVLYIKEAGGDRMEDWSGPSRFREPGEQLLPVFKDEEGRIFELPREVRNYMEGREIGEIANQSIISQLKEMNSKLLSSVGGIRSEVQGIMDDHRDAYHEGVNYAVSLVATTNRLDKVPGRFRNERRIPYVLVAVIIAVAAVFSVLSYNPKLVEVLVAFASKPSNQVFIVILGLILAAIAYVIFRRSRSSRR
ncbi:MAG: hypothetical protein JRM78_04205 [Nitrososphaerota archaeon]|nr:hypothetical protein [Nitrososphaerota archaeon]